MIWKFNKPLQEEAPTGTEGGAGGTAEGGANPNASPNADWKNNPNLDANGNPVEGGAQNKPPAPSAQDKSAGDGDKAGEGTPKGEGQEQAPTNKTEYTYKPGDSAVKQVEGLLVDAGLTTKTIGEEMIRNDGKLEPTTLKSLVDKHGEAVASLVADKLETFHKANKDVATKRDQAVFDRVQEQFKDITEQDGKATWKELSDWAKANMPKSEREEINALLKRGGLSADLAVDALVNKFKSSDTFVQPAALEQGEHTNTSNGVAPLSRSEYTMEMHKLEEAGHIYGQSSKMAELDKRRTAGLRAGI